MTLGWVGLEKGQKTSVVRLGEATSSTHGPDDTWPGQHMARKEGWREQPEYT